MQDGLKCKTFSRLKLAKNLVQHAKEELVKTFFGCRQSLPEPLLPWTFMMSLATTSSYKLCLSIMTHMQIVGYGPNLLPFLELTCLTSKPPWIFHVGIPLTFTITCGQLVKTLLPSICQIGILRCQAQGLFVPPFIRKVGLPLSRKGVAVMLVRPSMDFLGSTQSGSNNFVACNRTVNRFLPEKPLRWVALPMEFCFGVVSFSLRDFPQPLRIGGLLAFTSALKMSLIPLR